jgi:nitrogen fixation protein FixH
MTLFQSKQRRYNEKPARHVVHGVSFTVNRTKEKRRQAAALQIKAMETTMVYTHVVRDLRRPAQSPMDLLGGTKTG